jgi:hypothetical protein
MGIIDSRFITLIAYKEIAAEISVAISFFIKKAKKRVVFHLSFVPLHKIYHF